MNSVPNRGGAFWAPAPAAKPRPTAQWTRRIDMTAVSAIEELSYSPPWSAEEFDDFTRSSKNHLTAVVTVNGWVEGYALFRRRKRSLLLVRAAVRAESRRRGYARLLLDFAGGYCQRNNLEGIVVEVGEADLDAQQWLRACGVSCVRVLEGVYRFVARP